MTDSSLRPSRLDRWLSIAAGIGAICAVAVALYQAALAREQQRASAWPYLAQSNSYVVGLPYTRQVENQGVGPARVRSFEVLVDGRPVQTWDAAVRAMAGAPDSGLVYSGLLLVRTRQRASSRCGSNAPAVASGTTGGSVLESCTNPPQDCDLLLLDLRGMLASRYAHRRAGVGAGVPSRFNEGIRPMRPIASERVDLVEGA